MFVVRFNQFMFCSSTSFNVCVELSNPVTYQWQSRRSCCLWWTCVGWPWPAPGPQISPSPLTRGPRTGSQWSQPGCWSLHNTWLTQANFRTQKLPQINRKQPSAIIKLLVIWNRIKFIHMISWWPNEFWRYSYMQHKDWIQIWINKIELWSG